MTLNTLVLYGSVRSDRQGIKFARFLDAQIKARGNTSTLIDPLDHPLPLLDKMYKEFPKGEAPAVLETLAGHIAACDGVLVVTGEYNHGIPPALTNLLDHFLEEWLWRPSAIACYSAGPFGGVRAAIHLRAVLCELGMPSISSMFPMPRVQAQFAEDGTPTDPAHERRVKRFLDEFDWYARALKAARAEGVPY